MSVCSQLKFTRYLAHEHTSLKMLQEGFLRPEEDYFETSGVGGGGGGERKRFAEYLALKGEGETL